MIYFPFFGVEISSLTSQICFAYLLLFLISYACLLDEDGHG